MRTLRRKALAMFMAVLLGMASFAVLAEESLESENKEVEDTVESVSNGDSVIYDKTSEKPGDVENEDTVDEVASIDIIDTDDVIDAIDAVNMDADNMADAEKELEELAEDQGLVYAVDDIASGVDGDITWVIDASGKLTVNGTGDLLEEGLGRPFSAWLSYNEQIISAEINLTGMTDASFLFFGCANLTSLDMSGFDTSNVTSMSRMFDGCSSLTSLDVSNFNTGNVTDMYGMFEYCSGLTSLDVSGFNTDNVTDMSSMFVGCGSLSSLDVSSFNTSNVTDMSYMFWGCGNLMSLDVSSFNTSNVTDMSSMFSGCRNLTSLDVSGINTGNVTGMFRMFEDCGNLTSLDVSGFNTSSVTDMRWMFINCGSLTSLDVSGFDTSNVTYMGEMFWGCSSLTGLDISGFNTNNVTEDLSYMFWACSSLITLQSPCSVNTSVLLPVVDGCIWYLPDGTEVTELPQGLSYSVTLTRSDTTPQIITTTDDLNMDDVIRVKYVPYSYTVVTDNTDEENTVTFSIAEGSLAEGLQMYPATGEIYGVPLEAGEFKVTVMATYSNPEYPSSYAELTLIVLDNTDDNVGVATDFGYDITQPVADFNMDAISGDGTQTLVSQGEYTQFQHIVYIDGKLLEEGEGKDYTSEAGSTRITILNQTLADGGEGTHTLGIEFRTEDGTLKRAAQNYTVSSSSKDDGEKDKPGDGGNGEQNPGNESGDDKPSAGNIPENSGNDSNIGKADSSNKDIGIDVIPVKNSLDEGAITTVEYTVVSGDTLWSIAERFYGNGYLWTKIYEDNAEIIRDANKIYVGQVITIYLTEEQTTSSSSAADPEKSVTVDGEIYVVQSGDSLWKIAVKFYDNGHQWRKIYEANQEVLRAPSKIYVGQVLVIPDR